MRKGKFYCQPTKTKKKRPRRQSCKDKDMSAGIHWQLRSREYLEVPSPLLTPRAPLLLRATFRINFETSASGNGKVRHHQDLTKPSGDTSRVSQPRPEDNPPFSWEGKRVNRDPDAELHTASPNLVYITSCAQLPANFHPTKLIHRGLKPRL